MLKHRSSSRTHKFVTTNFVQANKINKLPQHGEIEHFRFDDDICQCFCKLLMSGCRLTWKNLDNFLT